MAIQLKSPSEIAKLREANLIVAEVLDALEAASKPGVATWELNEIAAVKLRQLKAEPAFLNYGHPPYPAVVCTSVNHVVVHGVPRRDVVLKEGDILSIDFGAFKDGWCGDSARTVPIGQVSPAAKALMDATRESLDRAIAACIPGNRLGGPVARRKARLLGGPPVRGPRHRPRHARGAPRSELRGRRQRAPTLGRSGGRHRADGQRR